MRDSARSEETDERKRRQGLWLMKVLWSGSAHRRGSCWNRDVDEVLAGFGWDKKKSFTFDGWNAAESLYPSISKLFIRFEVSCSLGPNSNLTKQATTGGRQKSRRQPNNLNRILFKNDGITRRITRLGQRHFKGASLRKGAFLTKTA